MSFSALCKSDPLLDFIRETYAATPIRLPYPRWCPFAIFNMAEGQVRYLGNAAELAEPGQQSKL